MNQCKGQISKIESFSTTDGPGIRTVIFLNLCLLRCKFCHNPETWKKQKDNYTTDELLTKVLRNKPYFQNNGGITFSGGEPLLQDKFLIDLSKKLKKENIHIAIDTAGIGKGNYSELLNNIDLVILDVKHITKEGFKQITQIDKFDEFKNFINELNKSNKEVWIRQVIIPDVNDNENYIKQLANFIKENINNVTNIQFLPFHTMGFEKYNKLNIKNPYIDKQALDKEKCQKLYEKFNIYYKKEHK